METEAEATNRADPARPGRRRAALRRPRLVPAVGRADRARAREGLERLGRDLHPVPLHRRHARSRSRTGRGRSTSTRRRRGRRRTRSTSGRRSRTIVLSAVSTDHCPFNWPEQKGINGREFQVVPNGGPGIENRLHMLHEFGVRTGPDHDEPLRRADLDEHRQAASASTRARARSRVGSDADIVVWDPEKKLTISAEHAPHERQLQPVRGHRGHRRAGRSCSSAARRSSRTTSSSPSPGAGQFVKRARFGEELCRPARRSMA